MPGTIVVAATATGVQPPYGLQVGGTQVLRDYSGLAYGVPLESIEVTEGGSGSVSSMTFTIDDPTKIIGLSELAEVIFTDFTNNVPLFRGYVDHWVARPDFGGQGRTYEVSAIGVEAWLDWLMIKPAFTIPYPGAAPTVSEAIVTAYGGTYGGKLRVIMGATSNGSFAGPVGTLTRPAGFRTYTLTPLTLDGVSFREAISTIVAYSYYDDTTGAFLTAVPLFVTVDFSLGLRVWPDYIDAQPDDYTTLTVTDTTAGFTNAEPLEHGVEPGDATHEVYIIGFNAAGTGWVSDGTGLRGKQAVITPLSAPNDEVGKRRTAASFFLSGTQIVRGSLELTDFTPPATVHAGSLLALTDAATGATATYRIYTIRKTFTGTRQNWVVSYGGNPPSATALMRKLTRTVAA
jgi:hypothetical protein